MIAHDTATSKSMKRDLQVLLDLASRTFEQSNLKFKSAMIADDLGLCMQISKSCGVYNVCENKHK